MIDTELDDAMTDLLQEASQRPDGTLNGVDVHPVGRVDVWRGPAMSRLCTQGLFEVRERPKVCFVLTDAGRAAAREIAAA